MGVGALLIRELVACSAVAVARHVRLGVDQQPFAHRQTQKLKRDIEVGEAPIGGAGGTADPVAEIRDKCSLDEVRRCGPRNDLAIDRYPADSAPWLSGISTYRTGADRPAILARINQGRSWQTSGAG